jgi:transcriptional regulator with XRE-family HTH domain
MSGRLIRLTRKRLGIDQATIARQCGVSQSTVSRWEAGAPVPIEHLEVLASMLNLRPEQISPEYAPITTGDGRVRPKGRVVDSYELLAAWTEAVLIEEKDRDRRLVLIAVASFIDPGSWAVPITIDDLIGRVGNEAVARHHFDAILKSPWVEQVGRVEYMLRLYLPE